MYACDSNCYTYTNGHICKHIHRVHSLVINSCNPHETVYDEDMPNSESQMDMETPIDDLFTYPVSGAKCLVPG